MSPRRKYPRTPHLPWSPGASPDDLWSDLSALLDEPLIITEKMDGENTTLYRDGLHARSVDSRHHPSRSWVKSLHQQIADLIPKDWRICGENLYARHSIAYEALPSYFMVFSIWDEQDRCLSWDDTLEWCELLGLTSVPTLCRGQLDEASLRALHARLDLTRQEGFVARVQRAFARDDFERCVAKWVRPGHVQTDEHWMHKPVIPNGCAQPTIPGASR